MSQAHSWSTPEGVSSLGVEVRPVLELGKQGSWGLFSGLAQKPHPILQRRELRLSNIDGSP